MRPWIRRKKPSFREFRNDEATFRQVLEQRINRAMFSAVGILARAAQGGTKVSEAQLQSCLALVRLAMIKLRKPAPPPPESLIHPSNPPEYAEQLLKLLEARDERRADEFEKAIQDGRFNPNEPYTLETVDYVDPETGIKMVKTMTKQNGVMI